MSRVLRRIACYVIVSLLLTSAFTAVGLAQYDFGGQTVKIAAYWGLDFTEGERLDHKEWVEETFNVKLEFNTLPWSDLGPTIRTTTIAGDPIGDIVMIDDNNMWPLALEGLLMPLNDVLSQLGDYYESLPLTHRDSTKYTSIGGKIYGFSFNEPLPGARALVWNKDLFEREGLPDLYELQESGEWTWDVFVDIAIRATRDTDGDGQIDQWGFDVQDTRLWPVYTQIYGMCNGATTVDTVDGKVVFALDRPEALESIQLWHDLINVYKVIPGDPFTERADGGANAFLAGKVAMIAGNHWMLGRAFSEMEDDYGFVFFPKGPKMESYTAPVLNLHMLAITATTKHDPLALVELANALFELTDEYSDVEEFEQRALEDYGNRLVRDRESLDTWAQIFENWDYCNTFIPTPGLFEALDSALRGEKTPAAAMAEVKPQIQAYLDEIFGQ